MKFRKKPVVIEAFLCSDLIKAAEKNWKALPKCVVDAYEKGGFIFCPDKILINTLEGTMTAQPQDMVIQGSAGEFYPCKPVIFEMTYEKAE